MKLKNKLLSDWGTTRSKGFWRFVLIRGALGWGVTTAILYSLLMWAVGGSQLQLLLPIALVLFPVGGILWGACMWWLTEREYRQQQNRPEG